MDYFKVGFPQQRNLDGAPANVFDGEGGCVGWEVRGGGGGHFSSTIRQEKKINLP